MDSPTDEAVQETTHPVEASDAPDQQPIAPLPCTDDTTAKPPPESRKSNKFSNLVTLVTSSSRAAGENPGQLRSSQTTAGIPSSFSRKRPVDPKRPEEVDDIGRFVFFHQREKRYVDGLRRKTIPLQTFALSLSLGVAIGCVVAIVCSLAFRVFWNVQVQENSLGAM